MHDTKAEAEGTAMYEGNGCRLGGQGSLFIVTCDMKKGGVTRLNSIFGRLIGQPKVRRAEMYAEPRCTPNPCTVQFGGPGTRKRKTALGVEPHFTVLS